MTTGEAGSQPRPLLIDPGGEDRKREPRGGE